MKTPEEHGAVGTGFFFTERGDIMTAFHLANDSNGFLMVLGMSAAVFVSYAIVAASLAPLQSRLAHNSVHRVLPSMVRLSEAFIEPQFESRRGVSNPIGEDDSRRSNSRRRALRCVPTCGFQRLFRNSRAAVRAINDTNIDVSQ